MGPGWMVSASQAATVNPGDAESGSRTLIISDYRSSSLLMCKISSLEDHSLEITLVLLGSQIWYRYPCEGDRIKPLPVKIFSYQLRP